MKLAVVCLAALALVSGTDAFSWRDAVRYTRPWQMKDDSSAPAFCHGLDCPKFKVLNSTDVYEVRKYEDGDWVATSFEDSHFTAAVTRGFARLFEYLSGANEDSKKLKMTAPVSTMIKLGKDMKPSGNYTVAFYIPEDLQGKAPAPTSTDVKVLHVKGRTAYVSSFGGFATEGKLLEEAAALGQALVADGHEVSTKGFFFASYDPPYRLTGRHNEVLCFSKNK